MLAQRQVAGAPGEVPGFVPLLADLDLAGTVVTADALHTHRQHADWLVAVKHADYLFTVKANQPALLERCARLTWQHVPILDRTRDCAHGRTEIRTLKAVSVRGFGFPHTSQVLQVTRKVRYQRSGRRRKTQTVYAVTSLPHAQASPARLADLIRGHWAIENSLHYIRDVTFAEDASQVRSGAAPQVMAVLRNLVIGVLNRDRAGPVNLAAALRHHSRDPHRPWPPSESASDETDITRERRSPGCAGWTAGQVVVCPGQRRCCWVRRPWKRSPVPEGSGKRMTGPLMAVWVFGFSTVTTTTIVDLRFQCWLLGCIRTPLLFKVSRWASGWLPERWDPDGVTTGN